MGTFIGQEQIELEGGHIGFIVQSKYNRTGMIEGKVWLVDQDAVPPATFEIEVKAFNDSDIVPMPEGSDATAAQ